MTEDQAINGLVTFRQWISKDIKNYKNGADIVKKNEYQLYIQEFHGYWGEEVIHHLN